MKGIPLIFKGFFRNLNAKINVNYSGIPASWKIVETANENRYVNLKIEEPLNRQLILDQQGLEKDL